MTSSKRAATEPSMNISKRARYSPTELGNLLKATLVARALELQDLPQATLIAHALELEDHATHLESAKPPTSPLDLSGA